VLLTEFEALFEFERHSCSLRLFHTMDKMLIKASVNIL